MMAKPAAYAAGGQLLSAHEQGLRKDLDPRVLEYLRALKQNLADSTAWLNYAVSLSDYHWMNRHAADAVSMAIALNPFVAEYHFFRGYCHQKLGLLQEAAADLELAWRLDPNHENAGYYLGQTYFYMSEFERGCAAFERLMEISPPEAEWSAICNWQYLMLRMLGRHEEARAVSARITRETRAAEATGTLGNTWTDCQYLLSCWVYNGFITPVEAIAQARSYGALNRWYVTMYMALYCELEGRATEAIGYYEETIATFPEINGTETTKMEYIIEPHLKALKSKNN